MAATGLQVCLLVVFALGHSVVGLFNEYTMDRYCGMTLNVGIVTSSFKLRLTKSRNYDPNMDCGLHISSNDFFSSKRYYVQFLDMDIDCSDSLQFFDGETRSASKLGSRMCGESSPLALASTGDDLFIKFKSDGSVEREGFTVLINTFHTGICKYDEFSCSNGRCIDKDLYCNDYDNCGDNSDYCYKDYNWWIWMIVGIVVFIVICVVITVVCCCLCKRKTTGHVLKPGTQTAAQPVVHYQSGTQGAQVNPWFGIPTQSVQQQPMGVQGAYPTGPSSYPLGSTPYPPNPYQPATMQPHPSYTSASGSAVYPLQAGVPGPDPSGTAPPPYSEKM